MKFKRLQDPLRGLAGAPGPVIAMPGAEERLADLSDRIARAGGLPAGPAFDAGRVAAVGRRIARGGYRIDPERIAAALLAQTPFTARPPSP